jgi:hypothetical protein
LFFKYPIFNLLIKPSIHPKVQNNKLGYQQPASFTRALPFGLEKNNQTGTEIYNSIIKLD